MRRTRSCFFAALLVSAANGGLLGSTGTSRTHRADDGLGNYQFGYDEAHSTGGTFRRESGNAVGAKIGSYGLRDIDGRYRVVHYVADQAGFRAQVSTNEPGTASSLTAAASYNAVPLVASPLSRPIYGNRIASYAPAVQAPAVAAVPAFSAPVYSAPERVATRIAFGTRVPVESRIAYAPAPAATLSPAATVSAPVAAPIRTYAAPVARIAAPITTYAAPATRLVAAPVATYAAPVAKVAAPVATYAAPVARFAAPVATYAAPAARFAAPVATYAAPVAKFAAPIVTYAAPVYAAPFSAPRAAVAAPLLRTHARSAAPVLRAASDNAGTGFLYTAPMANGTVDDGQTQPAAPAHVQADSIARMNSAPPAAISSDSFDAGNNPRLFTQAANAPAASTNNAPSPPSYTPRRAVPQLSYTNQEVPSPMSTEQAAAQASAPHSAVESNSTDAVGQRATPANVPFTYSAPPNFFIPRVNFTVPQFRVAQPSAFNAPFLFDARFINSVRNSPAVSDAPVTPVPAFAPAAPVTAAAPAAPAVANSTFAGPAFPFAYSFPQLIDTTTSRPQTTPAPAVAREQVPTTAAPTTTPSAVSSAAPLPNAINAAFPAGLYAGPVATPAENATAPSRPSSANTPITNSEANSPTASFFSSSYGFETPIEQISFSSQRLRAPVYAPVATHRLAYAAAPIVSQYAVYAPVAHYTSAVHTRVDTASHVPAAGKRDIFPARVPERSPATVPDVRQPVMPEPSTPAQSPRPAAPEVQPPRVPEQVQDIPRIPEPAQDTPRDRVQVPEGPRPRFPEPAVQAPEVPRPRFPEPTVQVPEVPRPRLPEPSVQSPEVATSAPSQDDDEDVADPRNAPPMFAAREDVSAQPLPASSTTESAPSTTEIPTTAEANSQSNVEQRNLPQNASDASLFSANRPVSRVVVTRRRVGPSVYATQVVRAPSAYRAFVPLVRSAPVVHYAAIPKAGPAYYAVPAVRYH